MAELNLSAQSHDAPVTPTNKGVSDGEEPPAKRKLYSSEVLGTYNLVRIATELGTREQGVNFAEEQGLIPKTKLCRVHKAPMNIDYNHNKAVGSFYCAKGKCRGKRISRAQGTWFENVRLDMPHIFYLMYCFAHNWSHDKVIWEDFLEEQCLSRATITDWYSYCRDVIVLYQIDKTNVQGIIGGPEKEVQTDESKFGGRKYNKDVIEIEEYNWRKDLEKRKLDPFIGLIEAIKHIVK